MDETFDPTSLYIYSHTDGQKIAKKLATQVTKETNSVKSLVYEYNALTRAGGESSEIGITEALDPHNIEGQNFHLYATRWRQEEKGRSWMHICHYVVQKRRCHC